MDHSIQLSLQGGHPITIAMMSSVCYNTGCDCHMWVWWLVYVHVNVCMGSNLSHRIAYTCSFCCTQSQYLIVTMGADSHAQAPGS